MNGGQIVDPADATDDEMEPILKAVSCSWSMTQTSDIGSVSHFTFWTRDQKISNDFMNSIIKFLIFRETC